jgi:lipopolysaccharide/colanic/teichoic acid biosynthesis glycosyltransferase
MSKVAPPKTNVQIDPDITQPFSGSLGLGILDQELFVRMLRLERKRTERSQRPFVLMLLDSRLLLKGGNNREQFEKVLCAMTSSTRETDIKGWYEDGAIFGVIFTEIGTADGKSVTNGLLTRVTNALCTSLSIEQINEIRLSFHVFPHSNQRDGNGPTDSTLYADLDWSADPKRGARIVKRSMDIAGSLFALILFSPLFILIAIIIKLTSPGPILFRQERVGQHGKRFTFLKFRSMYFTNDHLIHQEYVKRLIAGTNGSEEESSGRSPEVYKLTNDPRITPFGKILRKTSIDELPQFLNVLTGSMSLVGPRPPVPYEFDCYQMWHRQRLVAVKPGITGPWQVGGRSRTTFDEMVRMDLKYASSWTPWTDFKIILQTPGAVLSGEGAY